MRNPELLRQYKRDAVLDLLALGLDPAKAVLFMQSDVPEVSQLTWLLMTCTPMGLLERCHAYKDKKERGLHADAGLFTYPVLMAADILAYDANWVPVGQDQVQHIEVCRDLASSFNHLFGEVFVLPEARLLSSAAKVPGTDGEKMSKSYNNTIELFEDPKAMRKKIMRIATDSRPMEQPKDPHGDHLFQLYQLFATPAQIEELAAIYRQGGFGYGEVKKRLAEAAEQFFDQARQRRQELANRPDTVKDILAAGAPRPPAGQPGLSAGGAGLRYCRLVTEVAQACRSASVQARRTDRPDRRGGHGQRLSARSQKRCKRVIRLAQLVKRGASDCSDAGSARPDTLAQ